MPVLPPALPAGCWTGSSLAGPGRLRALHTRDQPRPSPPGGARRPPDSELSRVQGALQTVPASLSRSPALEPGVSQRTPSPQGRLLFPEPRSPSPMGSQRETSPLEPGGKSRPHLAWPQAVPTWKGQREPAPVSSSSGPTSLLPPTPQEPPHRNCGPDTVARTQTLSPWSVGQGQSCFSLSLSLQPDALSFHHLHLQLWGSAHLFTILPPSLGSDPTGSDSPP